LVIAQGFSHEVTVDIAPGCDAHCGRIFREFGFAKEPSRNRCGARGLESKMSIHGCEGHRRAQLAI
jgi:hypothetical protein